MIIHNEYLFFSKYLILMPPKLIQIISSNTDWGRFTEFVNDNREFLDNCIKSKSEYLVGKDRKSINK